ncbi:MAG: hypothetical protein WD275_08000 [Rhodothermales bacterium]
MGQQQLLLLVIGVIVVGFAVLAGFAAGQTKMKQNAADNLVDRNLSIATEAVYWKTKRDPFNGGNAQYTGLETDGMQTLFLGEETNNGLFQITSATDEELEITAVSLTYPEIGARTLVRDYEIVSTEVRFDGSITLDSE